MKTLVLASLAALAVAACTSTQSAREGEESAEAELATVLEGRTAGRPVSCINMRGLGGNRSFGENAILFEGPSNNVVWVNRPRNGCPMLTRSRSLRFRTTSTQLCSGDVGIVFDAPSGIEFGGCILGEFTPYTR